MKLTDLFVKRPVLAIVVNLVILIAGLQSIRTLVVRQFPRSDMANVVVRTAYVGANADLVRGFITAPLERVIAGADGIDYLESSSAQGVSTITVHLKLNYDTNAALTQIQSKVAQVRNQLPPEAEAPIIDLQTVDEFKQLVVKQQNGDVVRLGDIADVVLGAETYDQQVSFNGQNAVFIGIFVLPTANTLDVMKRVRAAMPDIQAQLPAGMTAGVPYDSSEYIQTAIDEVLKTLTETLLIVIVVIFLFLGSFRGVI